MSDKKIRVPATTVQLVQILGTILREHVMLWGTECWTFEHVADWEIRGEEPGPNADEIEHWEYRHYENPRHAMNVYLGSGNCRAFGYGSDPGNAKRLELRVRCEYSRWGAADLSYWDFQIWIKLPDGSREQYHYSCDLLGYGDNRDISPVKDSQMPHDPPRKIAFWRPAEEKLLNIEEP